MQTIGYTTAKDLQSKLLLLIPVQVTHICQYNAAAAAAAAAADYQTIAHRLAWNM